jgi:hypothetical protein
MRAAALLLPVLLALIACGAAPADPTPPDHAATVLFSGPLDPQAWPHDAYTLETLAISGDTLRLDVSYGGGCRDHVFQLVISTTFLESEPVQARSVLAHDAQGDLCKALVHATLSADLTPLKQEWRRQYQKASGKIRLFLVGPDREVLYSF